MTILSYSPWSEVDSVQRQINQILNDVLVPATSGKANVYSNYPAAELTETTEALLLKLEVPGMNKSDIEIERTISTHSTSSRLAGGS